MELWLQQHWVTLTGGGLSLGPGAIWLYRRLRFEHFYVAGDLLGVRVPASHTG